MRHAVRRLFVVDDGEGAGESEEERRFVMEMLDKMNARMPEKCSEMLKKRGRGTMSAEKDVGELRREAEEVRRRQEHMDGRVAHMPVLMRDDAASSSGLSAVRNAFVSELRDLYAMVWSMESRRHDICRGDIRALFSWFQLFEDATRQYLISCTRWLPVTARFAARRRGVARGLDGVARMRRAMLAHRGAGALLPTLSARVDELAVPLARLLRAEAALPLAPPLVERAMAMMARRSRGREVVALLAIATPHPRPSWAVAAAASPAARVVVETHTAYVRAFVRAEMEYRSLYLHLAAALDRQIARIHCRRYK